MAAAISKDPSRHFASRQAVLDTYRKFIDQMYPKLRSLFGRLPAAKLEIWPVEEFREKTAAAAEYNLGSPDGSRPGRVKVNTGDFAEPHDDRRDDRLPRGRPWASPADFHRAGDPGPASLPAALLRHGLHRGLGALRRAARRGGRVLPGPVQLLGHLQDEMLRAIRLVVDTGLHRRSGRARRPSTSSTRTPLRTRSRCSPRRIATSQSPGRRSGTNRQLRILELREKARKALGDKFDIRAFHDVVLRAGALPLDVLTEQVDGWIAATTQRPGGMR